METGRINSNQPNNDFATIHVALIGITDSQANLIIPHLLRLGCVCHRWKDEVEFELVIKNEQTPTLILINWNNPQINPVELVKQIRFSAIIPFSYTIGVVDRQRTTEIGDILSQNIHDVISTDSSANELQARLTVAYRILLDEHKLYQQAMKDELTELFNRRFFLKELKGEIRQANKNKSTFCLVYADIDYFKLVNDQFGHIVGDQVLKYVSHMMKEFIRTSDTLSRIGGEEFSIICRETNLENCIQLCQRIQAHLASSPCQHQNQTIPITISFGICEFGPTMQTVDDLLSEADQQLYRAKNFGRNQIFTRLTKDTPEQKLP